MPMIHGLKLKALALVAVATAWSPWWTLPAVAYGPRCIEKPPVDGRFPRLLADADAVVAAEITDVTPWAAAVEAPWVVEAEVNRVLKGEVPAGSVLFFAESPWCGPTYRRGELRLLFLAPLVPPPTINASWWNLCPVTGKLDCFLDRREGGELSLSAVEDFLELLSRVRSRPLALTATILSWRPPIEGLAIRVVLLNQGGEGVWLDPARLRVVAADRGVLRTGVFEPATGPGWTLIPPGGEMAGIARVAAPLPDGRGVVLTIHSDAALFPRPCWTGTLTSPLLEPPR